MKEKEKEKENEIASRFAGIVILIGIVIAVIFIGNFKSSNPEHLMYSESHLSAMENNFNFNTISMKDGDVTHQFEIKNEGNESVIIEKIYTSCMCTVANVIDTSGKEYKDFGMPGHGGSSKTNIIVNAGETIFVDAIYDPNAHGPSGVGLAQRSIYLETNSANSPKLELKFQATVVR